MADKPDTIKQLKEIWTPDMEDSPTVQREAKATWDGIDMVEDLLLRRLKELEDGPQTDDALARQHEIQRIIGETGDNSRNTGGDE